MNPLLLTGGIILLLLGLLLLIAAVVMYFIGRNKAAPAPAAAGFSPPNRPPMPPPVVPPVPQPHHAVPPPPPPPYQAAPQPHQAVPQPHQVPVPPPPPAGGLKPAATPPPPPQPPATAGDTDATVVAERITFGALHATAGPLAGQTFPLTMDGMYIGRDRSVSQIVIDNPSVSKRHVWVGLRDGVPTAVDQSSTNGTYLNTLGTRIGQVRLSPGDTLIISDDVARFVYRA